MIAFPIYESIEDQYFRKSFAKNSDFPLRAYTDRLLPFSYSRPSSSNDLLSIEVIDLSTGAVSHTINPGDIAYEILVSESDSKDFFMYYGVPITGLSLDPCEEYYIKINEIGGSERYSEVFKPYVSSVIDKMVRLEFWNENDIGDFIYQSGFKNVILLDSNISRPDYIFEKDSQVDQQGEDIQIFSKSAQEMRVAINPAPQHIVRALNLIGHHTNVQVFSPDYTFSGITTTSIEGDWIGEDLWQGDFIFRYDVISKTRCNENRELYPLGMPPVNLAPEALSVTISGTLFPANILTGSYTYFDHEGDLEASTTKQWYLADDAAGTNKTAIAGANGDTYTIQNSDGGKFICFEVTPVAATGTMTGSPACSDYEEIQEEIVIDNEGKVIIANNGTPTFHRYGDDINFIISVPGGSDGTTTVTVRVKETQPGGNIVAATLNGEVQVTLTDGQVDVAGSIRTVGTNNQTITSAIVLITNVIGVHEVGTAKTFSMQLLPNGGSPPF